MKRKSIFGLLMAILMLVSSLSFTAFAAAVNDNTNDSFSIVNNGKTLVIELNNTDTVYYNTIDNVVIKDVYSPDVWQIGAKTNNNLVDGEKVVWAKKEVSGNTTKVTVNALKNGKGSIYLAKYAYDTKASGQYKATIDAYLKIDYVIQNRKFASISGGDAWIQSDLCANGINMIVVPNSGNFTKYKIPKNWNGKISKLSAVGTSSFDLVTALATDIGGLTKAMKFTGKHTKTETVQMPMDYDTLFTKVASNKGSADIYYHAEYNDINTLTMVGSATVDEGIVSVSVTSGLIGQDKISIKPKKEGTANLYFATYKEDLTVSSIPEDHSIKGTPYAMYKMAVKVSKDSAGKLYIESVKLKDLYIGKSINIGGDKIGEKVITHYITATANTVLMPAQKSALLKEWGLPEIITLEIPEKPITPFN